MPLPVDTVDPAEELDVDTVPVDDTELEAWDPGPEVEPLVPLDVVAGAPPAPPWAASDVSKTSEHPTTLTPDSAQANQRSAALVRIQGRA